MKRWSKKRKIITLAVVLIIAAVVVVNMLRPDAVVPQVYRTATLSTMDLRNTVDVTGTVKSDETVNVYSTLSYPVASVLVSVGDVVEEGDVLCVLDPSSLESEILAKQASISAAQRDAQLTIQQAESDLLLAQQDLASDQTKEVVDARFAVEEAERTVTRARHSLNQAQSEYSDARYDQRSGEDVTDVEIDRLRLAANQASKTLETAQADLIQAQLRLERAEQDAERGLQDLQDKLTTARNAADMTTEYINLQKLQDDLEKCEIIAPASGTVTAVNAEEGAGASGLLVVIQDIDRLIVSTKIKEIDVNIVQVGDSVIIRSDATGNEEYQGVVRRIAPASLPLAEGASSGTTAEFEAEIEVLSAQHGLRIGMNARVNIVVDSAAGVMAVPYDAVITDELGNPALLIARAGEAGYTAELVTVTVGLDTDFYTQVSGADLAEGDLVLLDPLGIVPGQVVLLDVEVAQAAAGGM